MHSRPFSSCANTLSTVKGNRHSNINCAINNWNRKKPKSCTANCLNFFTQVAHEFRTPLTLILNPLDELSAKTVHISGIGNMLALIRQNTNRLLSLVNNLLDLQKQESGKTELHLSVFGLSEFMQEPIL